MAILVDYYSNLEVIVCLSVWRFYFCSFKQCEKIWRCVEGMQWNHFKVCVTFFSWLKQSNKNFTKYNIFDKLELQLFHYFPFIMIIFNILVNLHF